MTVHRPKVFLIKFYKGYLVCDYVGSLMSGNLTPFAERANIFTFRTDAIQMGDRFEKFFGPYKLLDGESQGHIIHKLDMEERNVDPIKLPGVHGKHGAS